MASEKVDIPNTSSLSLLNGCCSSILVEIDVSKGAGMRERS